MNQNNRMNTIVKTLAMTIAVCVGWLNPIGAEPQGHKHLATPKGGRLLDKTDPHAEFLVEKDRTVTIHFYSADMKPVAASTQTVVVLADLKSGKAKVEFEKKGDVLVSKTKLPDGEGYNIIVQFKQTAEAKPLNLRFKLDQTLCSECQRAEYACICDH